jgi:2-oxo-4-hydroxy-4-carboxy-5-ureidoimidazoline decarboxylase
MQAAFTLDALNDLGPSEFAAALGDIFEHAPWVAERACQRRPFATVTALHEAMLASLAAAPAEAVTGFLNNHPDLAGPASRVQPLTAASQQEQSIAGLDALTQEDTARLAGWNAHYRKRFGFPFIISARRHTHGSIFAEFERRLAGEPEAERRAALGEIARITALRLFDRVDGPGKPKVHGRLSTHLLDTARGCPAAGVAVQLFVLSDDGAARLIAEAVTDADGRTPQPLVAGRPVPIGTYELGFSIGDYLVRQDSGARPFLDIVPVRFGVAEPEAHYHIPLLFTPWSYSTYRGS